MRGSVLRYTLGRFGLFFLVAIILWGAAGLMGKELNGLPLLLLSALVSSLLGYVLFARQRQELAAALDAQRKARAEHAAELRTRLENES